MKYETKCRANKSERDTLTLYPKGGAKGKNIKGIYSANGEWPIDQDSYRVN